MANPPIQPTDADVQDYLQHKYLHVMRLLNVSPFEDDQKRAWVELLPLMTMEQLNRFIALLEQMLHTNLEESLKRPEDQRFIDQLKEATQFHDEEVANIRNRTLKGLQAIADELPNPPTASVQVPRT
ncbi:hypothetical protein HZA86_01435 [Candidatus Uhrbacteria bacterium]|nr:hypothetical protein [Candidatus Uhrbacteria bacterium]